LERLGTTFIFNGSTAPSRSVVRVGLILISTDEVGGDAFREIMPDDDVSVFTTRGSCEDSWEGFAFKSSFKEVTDTLPPADRLDVLAFSCTSATVELGIEGLLSELSAALPGVKYTSPAIAAIEALNQLGAKKVALLTPYPLSAHRSSVKFFEMHGFTVAADGTFDKFTDAEIGELQRDSIFAAANALVGASDPDAIFISCTATPVVQYIDQLESELGIPVVTSSQAMAWHTLRLAGYNKPILRFGRLLATSR
jgi:maleate isomerase